MRMCHFRAQNGPFVLNKNFLVQTIVITFIYLLAFFIVQNPELWRSTILGHQNGPFAPNNFFFWKIITIILIYLLPPFIVQN